MESLSSVQMAVNRAHDEMDTGMPSMVEVMPRPWPTPPTHFKLNEFTIAFQVGYDLRRVKEGPVFVSGFAFFFFSCNV